MRPWTAALIAIVLVSPAVAWCGSAVDREYTRGQDSRRWPAATGRVLSSDWAETTTCDEDGCEESYDVHISYEYQVGGERYEATRYRFGWPQFVDKGDVKKIVAQHPPGKPLPVYYDPYDPGVSTLRRGLPWSGFILTVVGLALIVIFAWFLAFGAIRAVLDDIGRRRESRRPDYGWGAPFENPNDWEGPGRLGTER